MRVLAYLVAALSSLASCTEPSGGPDAGVPDAAGWPAQGGEARAPIVINEIAPRPAAGPDWLEIYNRSGEALDLCGYLVTDLADRLDHYTGLAGALPGEPCEPMMLDPGDYLVVIADDGAGAGDGQLHARFELGRSDEVHLLTATGRVVDGLSYYLPVDDGSALARQPSGAGAFYPAAPSPGVVNPEDAP